MNKCSEVMSEEPICCVPKDSVTKVAKLMKTKDIGSIPVIENEKTKKVVGIVTDRDLTVEVLAEQRDPKTTKVEEVMTRHVLTCHPDDDLQRALDAMSGYRLRRIPVVDRKDQIVGVITQADVALHVEQPEKVAAMVKDISQSSVYLLER